MSTPPTPRSVTVAGICWNLTPAGRDLLVATDLHLDDHVLTKRATIVKQGEHRAVYRVALTSGTTVYWKHCRLSGSRAWWRDILRGPKAKLEFDRTLELAARGINTTEPLASGKFDRRWPAGSFLITRALEGTIPLDEHLLNHAMEAGERRSIAKQLAAFVAKLHDAGVTHPDLHPGNMLVRPGAVGLEIFLIDVHDVLLGKPLSRRARVENLILLNRWFVMRSNRTDRARFWRAYAGKSASKADVMRIEDGTQFSNMRLWRNRDWRCLRENKDFRKLSGQYSGGFALRELDTNFTEKLAAEPDAPFIRHGVTLLKDSRSATVCTLEVPTSSGPGAMIYKRFKVPDWTDPFANLFRPSGALRSWRNGHALIARGLPTPRPFLVLHRHSFGMPTVGYLLCEQVLDARNLHDAAAAADQPAKRRLIDSLARWIRLMHDRCVSHRDLKVANILVTSSGECHFIDLVGVRLHGWVSDPLRVRDLTRLNASFVSSPHVTRTDRLRFLQIYLMLGLSSREDWRSWWKKIDLGTLAKIERNARRNRPLA